MRLKLIEKKLILKFDHKNLKGNYNNLNLLNLHIHNKLIMLLHFQIASLVFIHASDERGFLPNNVHGFSSPSSGYPNVSSSSSSSPLVPFIGSGNSLGSLENASRIESTVKLTMSVNDYSLSQHPLQIQ